MPKVSIQGRSGTGRSKWYVPPPGTDKGSPLATPGRGGFCFVRRIRLDLFGRPGRRGCVAFWLMARLPARNDFDGWVAQLGTSSRRGTAKEHLLQSGPVALPALRRG